MQSNKQITPTQVFVLTVSMILGVGVLTLPRSVASAVHTPDIWLSVLLAGLINLIPIAVIGKLSAIFPRQHFLHYSQQIIGKYMGWLLSLLYAFYFITLLSFEVRMAGEVVREYLMERTPREVLILLLFFASTYLVTGGLGAVVRINEMFLPVLMFFLLLALLLSFREVDPKNMQPMLSKGIFPLFKGVPETALSFLGYEIILFFSAYFQKPQLTFKAGCYGLAVVCFVYVLTVFVALGVFGVDTLTTLVWPTLEVVKVIEIPGGFVERLESIFITIWVMAIFTTISINHFLSSMVLGQLFRKNQRWFFYSILPVAYIIALYPPGVIEVFDIGTFASYFGLLLSTGIPIILLLVARLRKLGSFGNSKNGR